jgi:hypothetical protein
MPLEERVMVEDFFLKERKSLTSVCSIVCCKEEVGEVVFGRA